ncbi:MAG TPA: hypothetical protein VFV75_04790 [Candidatus Polarisedimenticolaceae bacterium]|nr:hypothetical protein [Candidatus Polarisedimenticolaceae bacterium]
MTGRRSLPRFLCAQALTALAGFAAASLCLALAGAGSLRWLAGGAGAMGLAGLATGAWLVAQHGGRLSRFLAGMVVGALVRMALVLAGAAPLALFGQAAFWSYVLGLAAVFVPMQVHEIGALGFKGLRGSA